MNDTQSTPSPPPAALPPPAASPDLAPSPAAAPRPASSGPLAQEEHTIQHADLLRETIALEYRRFSLWYGRTQAIADVSLPVAQGKVTALIGPSGCGKSTLLRSANRLNDLIDGVRIAGEIRIGGRSVHGRDIDVIALRKRMGMVFQKSNPFPMSILENAVYALRIDGERRRAVLEEAAEESLRAAALWNEVKDRLHGSAFDLSGGQQQRLCIARAIAARPEILLMDEPCSALDPTATARIEELLRSLRSRYTILIVTHNMQQAARVSDFTAFLQAGRLVEIGPTAVVFEKPKSLRTRDYITGRFG